MRRFLMMLIYEIRASLRDVRPMVCGLALALFAIAAVRPLTNAFAENAQDTAAFRIALVDMEDSMYTRMAAEHIRNAPSLTGGVTIVFVSENEAYEMMRRNEIPVAVIIPEGFTDSMQGGALKEIKVVLNNGMPFQAGIVADGIHGGLYLMSAVQNTLYVVYGSLIEAGMNDEKATQLFNMQMLSLIGDALARDSLFETERVTAWGGGMVAFYMTSALLAYLCVAGTYHIYRKDSVYRRHFRDRVTSLNQSGALVEAVDVMGTTLLVYVPCVMVYMAVSVLCEFPWVSFAPALLVLFAVCIHLCSVNHLLQRWTKAEGILPAAVLVAHFVLLVLAGCVVPHSYLFAGQAGNPWFSLIPHYVWHNALYLPAQNGAWGGGEMVRLVGPTVLHGLVPFAAVLFLARDWRRLKGRVR